MIRIPASLFSTRLLCIAAVVLCGSIKVSAQFKSLNDASFIQVPAAGIPAFRESANSLNTVFDYPLEDCFTYTYKLTIGDAGAKTFIKGTATTRNGETYTAGYSEDAAGKKQGMLQQLNHTGGIGWTRSISFPDRTSL